MGISTEQWRARIGTYIGGRGSRVCGAHLSSFDHPGVFWTTEEFMNVAPQTLRAGLALVSWWILMYSLSYWWKRIGSSYFTKLNGRDFYHLRKVIRATVSIFMCVALVTAAAVLLHCLTLLLMMAGDVELNPGPGMNTELTIADLSTVYEKLYTAKVKWFEIGLFLRIDYDTLRSIEASNFNDIEKCLMQVLVHRLKAVPPLTWRELYECLRSLTVSHNAVAEQIRMWIESQSTDTFEQTGIASRKRLTQEPVDESPLPKNIKLEDLQKESGKSSEKDSTESQVQELCEKAIKEGYVIVEIANVLLYGMAGTGKTSTKHLIFGWPPPEERSSTALAEGSRVQIRNVSGMKAIASGDKWDPITGEDLEVVVAENAKNRPNERRVLNPPELKELASKLKQLPHSASTPPVGEISSSGETNEKEIIDSSLVSNTLSEIQALIHCDRSTPQLLDTKWIYFIDSGGQPYFHHLLPLFLETTSLAIYFLRLSRKDGLNDYPIVEYYRNNNKEDSFKSQYTPADNFKSLLQSIQSSNNKDCMLMCVGTHSDMVDFETIAQRDSQLRQLIPEKIQEKCFFSNISGDDHEEQFMFDINAITEYEEKRKPLKESLRVPILKCPTEKVIVPIWWYVLEVIFKKTCIKKKRNILSLTECRSISKQLYNFDEVALMAALQFFHKKHILHYYPNVLPQVVFCETQLLLDKVTELVEHAAFLKSGKKQVIGFGGWKQFKSEGIFSTCFLKQFSKHYVPDLFEPTELVKIFQLLLIATPFDTSSSDTKYYMPALLTTLSTTELQTIRSELVNTIRYKTPLLIRFQNSWYRCGVFCCLQVYLIKQCGWTLDSKSSNYKPHQNCVKLNLPQQSCSIVLMDFINFIEVHVLHEGGSRSDVYAQIQDSIITGILSACKRLQYDDNKLDLAFLCPHTQLSLGPPAPKCFKSDCSESHPAVLLKDNRMRCSQCTTKLYPLDDMHKVWLSKSSPGGLNTSEFTYFAWNYWKLNELHDPSIRGDGSVVAVIDTNVQVDHVTFRDQNCLTIQEQTNFITSRDSSHGTGVAAVVCGRHVSTSDVNLDPSMIHFFGVNKLPIGVAPNAKFVSFSVATSYEEPYNAEAVVRSLECIIRHNENGSLGEKIRIIVFSFKLAATICDVGIINRIEELVGILQENGVVCVAAAGNDGLNESPGYPAKYTNVLSVGSVDKFGNRSKFSTFHSSVDVLAPGESILVPVNCTVSKNDLLLDSGTSFAAPAVAGLIALLIQCSVGKGIRDKAMTCSNVTNLNVLKKLFKKYMVLPTEQGNLLQPEKVIHFFNKYAHKLDEVVVSCT